jgi:flagellar biosynthesis/type III secretory pathway protein FliH
MKEIYSAFTGKNIEIEKAFQDHSGLIEKNDNKVQEEENSDRNYFNIESIVQEKLDKIVSQEREKAYQEGLIKSKSTIDEIIKRYTETIASLTQVRDAMIRQGEEEMLRLSYHLCEQILCFNPEICEKFTRSMLKHCLELFTEADEIQFKMNPRDISALKAYQPEIFNQPHIHFVEDESLYLGGIIATSKLGMIDASIRKRLNEIGQKLLKESLDK